MDIDSRSSLFSLQWTFTFFKTPAHFSASDQIAAVLFSSSLCFFHISPFQLVHPGVSYPSCGICAHAGSAGSCSFFSTSPALLTAVLFAVYDACYIFYHRTALKTAFLSCISAVPCSYLNVVLHLECYPHFPDHICNLSRSLNFDPGFSHTCSLLLLEIICKFNNNCLCVIIQLINEFNEYCHT